MRSCGSNLRLLAHAAFELSRVLQRLSKLVQLAARQHLALGRVVGTFALGCGGRGGHCRRLGGLGLRVARRRQASVEIFELGLQAGQSLKPQGCAREVLPQAFGGFALRLCFALGGSQCGRGLVPHSDELTRPLDELTAKMMNLGVRCIQVGLQAGHTLLKFAAHLNRAAQARQVKASLHARKDSGAAAG